MKRKEEPSKPEKIPQPKPAVQLKKKIIVITLIALILPFTVIVIVLSGMLNWTSEEISSCTADAMICPDGTAVGRTGPNCEFLPCPTSKPDQTAEKRCGYLAPPGTDVTCPTGYICQNNPGTDEGGICVINQ